MKNCFFFVCVSDLLCSSGCQTKRKWYKFNDTIVDEFDMNEDTLEAECFGGTYKATVYDTGESPSVGGGGGEHVEKNCLKGGQANKEEGKGGLVEKNGLTRGKRCLQIEEKSFLAFALLSLNFVKCNETKLKCITVFNTSCICFLLFKGGVPLNKKNTNGIKNYSGPS